MLYFEDIAEGQTWTSGTLTVHAAAVKAFAAEFDPQPFHLDEKAAQRSMFGRLAASGWHTAAMTMRMIVDGSAEVAGGRIGLGGDISWPRPTFPGDVLRVVSEVVAVKASQSRPDIGIVTIRYRTLNQDDEPVQIATMKVLVPRKPAGAGHA